MVYNQSYGSVYYYKGRLEEEWYNQEKDTNDRESQHG